MKKPKPEEATPKSHTKARSLTWRNVLVVLLVNSTHAQPRDNTATTHDGTTQAKQQPPHPRAIQGHSDTREYPEE
eukprot:9949344-Prorocentrum_lima.AAC.1